MTDTDTIATEFNVTIEVPLAIVQAFKSIFKNFSEYLNELLENKGFKYPEKCKLISGFIEEFDYNT